MKRDAIKRDALILGGQKKFRVWLTREWDTTKPSIAFVMLNPRTTDENRDDPTIGRCINFAEEWGFGELIVVNLFDFCTTDPKELVERIERLKRIRLVEYEEDVDRLLASSDRIIAAWGVVPPLLQKQIGRMMSRLLGHHDRIYALGITKDGHPKHPLRVSRTCEPMIFATKSE